MSDTPITQSDVRRAVLRTAVRANRMHDRTGGRAIASAFQDNDGWPSKARRDAFIAFARQAISSILSPSGRTEGTGAAAPSTVAAPHQTLPLTEPSGTAGATEMPIPRGRRRSGLFPS